MHFFTFLILLSSASVQSFPLHFNKCEEICSGRLFNSSSELHDTCRTGCQYFYRIESLTENGSNSTLSDCHLACDNSFNEMEERKPCVLGCDAVYVNHQDKSKPVPSPATTLLKGENFTKKHENLAISPIDAAEQARVKNLQRIYYEEYEKLQYRSVIQLSIFCMVLITIVACSVKVLILVYQFKFAAFKYMLDTSAESKMLKVASKKSTKLYYNSARPKK